MPDTVSKIQVHILLATYNGARFLREQLASITKQTHSNWTLTISDDGSTDQTLDILSQFQKTAPQKIKIMSGSMSTRGSTENFLRLIQQVRTATFNDLFAFCDQDDVWLPDKLTRAVEWHSTNLSDSVRLYCARTLYVNEQLKPIGLSNNWNNPPSFGNALVENIASGNSMVMSHALIEALQHINPRHSVWHDWTTYLVATALNGSVKFDNNPCLLYRQHSFNVIGSNVGLKRLLIQLPSIILGRYRLWADLTELAVIDIKHFLPESNAKIFSDFQLMRYSSGIHIRIKIFILSSIRRQKFFANVGLIFLLLLKSKKISNPPSN